MSKGLTVGHRQKRCITSKPASYIRSHKNPDMQASVKPLPISPLLEFLETLTVGKLTVKGGEKDWIT